MDKPTGEEVLTLADTVASYGATRLAGVLRRSVELEAENERLRELLTEAKDLAWSFGADSLFDRIDAALRREDV